MVMGFDWLTRCGAPSDGATYADILIIVITGGDVLAHVDCFSARGLEESPRATMAEAFSAAGKIVETYSFCSSAGTNSTQLSDNYT